MRKLVIGLVGVELLGWVLWIRRRRTVTIDLEQLQRQRHRLAATLAELQAGQLRPEQVLSEMRDESRRLTEALGALELAEPLRSQEVIGELRDQSRRLGDAIGAVARELRRPKRRWSIPRRERRWPTASWARRRGGTERARRGLLIGIIGLGLLSIGGWVFGARRDQVSPEVELPTEHGAGDEILVEEE